VNIILFGPPGAGKGTQADNLAKDFNLLKISTGDLLREEIKKKSPEGLKINRIINEGKLVSDLVIKNFVEKIVSKKENINRLIFDGYPRNLNQVKDLENLFKKYNQKITRVLSFKVDKELIIKRILSRQVCSNCGLTFNEFSNPSSKNNHKCDSKFLQKRSDDNENTIRNRFDTYTKETYPVLNHYQNEKLLTEIDGMKRIDVIYKEIRDIINSLRA
jgi:adenylate kinase